MSQTKTAVRENLKSPERDLPPSKLRSPSPPPASDTRAHSLAPASPQSPSARLTSPPPESVSRTTVRERTPAPALAASTTEPSDEPESDPAGDEVRHSFALLLRRDADSARLCRRSGWGGVRH